MDNKALILANLTPEDDRRFHAAHVTYSGSTGSGSTTGRDGALAPYIATYVSELHRSVKAMGWHKYSIEEKETEWIVRCENAFNYYVAHPVPGDHNWWGVCARKLEVGGAEQFNFVMATFSEHMNHAEREAHALCKRLNESA